MSDSEQEPPADTPLKVRTRVPEMQRLSLFGVRSAATLYGVAALGMLAIALYMGFGRGESLLSVPVIAPALGAVWFSIRVYMTLRPKA